MFSLIDFLFILAILFFFYRGWKRGFLYLVSSFLIFISSFLLAIRYTDQLSQLLAQVSNLPAVWNVFISFILIAFIIEASLSAVFNYFIKYTARFSHSHINKAAGAVLSTITGLLFLSALIFFLLLMPIQIPVKANLQSSTIVPFVLSLLDRYGGPLPKVVQDSAARFTQFLTVAPKSEESVELTLFIDPNKLAIDPQSEARMLALVNQERQKAGVEPLISSVAIQDVSRAYSQKVLIEKRFAHIDAEGKDAGDRLSEKDVRYKVAGENLAYAMTVDIAHQGLMNSQGHKRNILDPQFKRIGIGVVDAGLWGKMFTQVFAD